MTMTLYNPIKGRVNDIVYTRFGLNLSISSQDMEQKPNSDTNSVANLPYMTHPNLELVDGKVYTKIGFNLSMSFILMILKESQIVPE